MRRWGVLGFIHLSSSTAAGREEEEKKVVVAEEVGGEGEESLNFVSYASDKK